jgi:hypothetical protein
MKSSCYRSERVSLYVHLSVYLSLQSRPCNGPWRPIGLSNIESPRFSRQSADRRRGGERRQVITSRKIPGTHFCYGMSRLHCHSAAGRNRTIKKSNDICNRTRDLPAGSIVPKSSTLLRAPVYLPFLFLAYDLLAVYLPLFSSFCMRSVSYEWKAGDKLFT